MKILVKIVITALAVFAVSYLVPGIAVSTFLVALLVALLLGLLNLVVKPILVLLTLPINIITLGLFMWVINGFLFWLVARFVDGFSVENFWMAILGALIVSVFAWIGEKAFIHNE